MSVKINLLPADYVLSGPLNQIVKVARPISVIALALFLITSLGMAGFFIFSSVSLNTLIASNAGLENQIKTQSTAQQQIVLLKDRLGLIKNIQQMPSVIKNFNNTLLLFGLVSGESLFSELDIDSQKISASLVFKSNSEMTNFIKSLKDNTAFSSVSMGTFNFSPITGYQIGLDIVGK